MGELVTASISPSQPAASTDRQKTGDYVLKGGWYTLWVMMALMLVANVDRQVLVLAGAPLAVALGLTDSELGMVEGLAFAIFAVVAVYPIAWAADRFDRRLVFGLCVLTWSLGTAACGLAQNFEQLFLAAVAIAAGEAGLIPIGVAFVPDLFKGRKRLLANSFVYFFAMMGAAGGLMLGGGAIAMLDEFRNDLPASLQAFESWRLAFFLVALPTPIFLLLLAFTRLAYRSEVPEAASEAAQQHDFWPFLGQHRRAVASVFVGIGCYMLGIGGFLAWLPVVATRLFGTTPGQNGSLMGIATAVGLTAGVAIGTYFVRRLVVRLGPVASIRFYWIALLAALPIFITFPFVGADWQLFALFGLLMLIFTAVGCAIPTILQDMAPPDLRGRMSAIWGIVNGTLAGLSPTLVGWVSGWLGPDPRLLLVAICLVAAPAWIFAALSFRMAERPFAELVNALSADPKPIVVNVADHLSEIEKG
ncbi:MFS transporter [Sphingosinicella rhizophila]|uniref:MFS transporter n=1 Tax=Sphingosinicella rhizophila TaxID=3050082 RepID=A0ABU3Q9Y3_9SPHN|nr:MFS transporter [Sphingosinicella sp. GR2756]MDT9600203.1 MFS transporter [Sphingosinicella sp. GR2756]